MSRFFQVIALVAVLLTTFAPVLARAQEAALIATPQAVPGLNVTVNEAAPEFPVGITFTLQATTETPVASVELLYHAPGIETLSMEIPPIPPGATELDITHPIDLQSGQLPVGVDVIYRWRITDEDGNVSETPDQTTHYFDTRYDWTELEGPRVTVYTYDASPEFRQAILDSAEHTIDRLQNAYGILPTQRIRIWAYPNKDDFYGSLAPNSEPWIAGEAQPALFLIRAILPPDDTRELDRVVPHEMTHQVSYQVTQNPFNYPPLWLNEGLAVYWQETGRDRFYSYALELAKEGNIPPLRTLNGEFAYDSEGALNSYALSLSVVIYILDTFGDEGMANLLDVFTQGVSYDEAVEQGLGVTFEELDAGWRAYITEKANQLEASGSTVNYFGDDGPAAPTSAQDPLSLIAEASGTLIIGLAVLIAVGAGAITLLRNRSRHDDDDEADPSGPDEYGNRLRWQEWPDDIPPPGWQSQARSASPS
ncbi:MAG: peptidase MA family metallohydrolase [Chloroflexota bacterium]|nr:peptidase MA family metallohydrolase [Chloroflexota bacterium]